jgi:hypothetical protein
MPNLNATQILALAANAGFQGDDLATAVAVALAESSGNPQAYNPEKAAGAAQGKGSFGLWQIYLTAHPEFAGLNLFDPQTNAQAAFSVYQGAGNSFQPWSTFGSGAYMAYMDAVTQAVAANTPPTTDDSGESGDGDAGSSSDAGVDDTDVGDDSTPSGTTLVTVGLVGALAIWGLAKIFGY